MAKIVERISVRSTGTLIFEKDEEGFQIVTELTPKQVDIFIETSAGSVVLQIEEVVQILERSLKEE